MTDDEKVMAAFEAAKNENREPELDGFGGNAVNRVGCKVARDWLSQFPAFVECKPLKTGVHWKLKSPPWLLFKYVCYVLASHISWVTFWEAETAFCDISHLSTKSMIYPSMSHNTLVGQLP